MRKIILASASPKRKELLKDTGLKFEIVPSDYEENMSLPLPPGELVQFLSKGKAESIAKNYEDAVIIGADTIIYFNGHILGKPHTPERAREMLSMLSGQEHSAFTGFTVIDTRSGKRISQTVETKVQFKELSDSTIDEYIKTGNPLKYAGSYTLNDILDKFVRKVEGDHSNIIGLPVDSVMRALESLDIKIK